MGQHQYIDDFIDRGRVKRVYVQSDAPYRPARDFNRWTVRNQRGEMVPFAAVTPAGAGNTALRLERFDGTPGSPSQAIKPQRELRHGVTGNQAACEFCRNIGVSGRAESLPGAARPARERQCSPRCRCS